MEWYEWISGALAVGIAGWFVRYAISVWRGDYGHAKGSKPVWWIPGHGGHGGGGQVPPLLANSDPDDEIP